MTAILAAITAACTAYAEWVKWQMENKDDETEDEIQRQLSLHTPAGVQRAQLLAARLNRKRGAQPLGALRPPDGDAAAD